MLYPYQEILFGNKNEETIDTCNNLHGHLGNYSEFLKSKFQMFTYRGFGEDGRIESV